MFSEFPKQYLNMPEMVNCFPANSDKDFGEVTGMTIMHERLYTSFPKNTELQIRRLTAAGERDLEFLDIPDGGHFRDLASIQSDKPSSPDIICIAESTMVIYFISTFVAKHKTKIKSINNIKSVLLPQQDLEGRKHLH